MPLVNSLAIFEPNAALSREDLRAAIDATLDFLLLEYGEMAGDSPEFQVEHHFQGGMYSRACSYAANSYIAGRIHLEDHFFILLEGELLVADADEGVRRLSAPAILPGAKGARRLALTLSPIRGANIYAYSGEASPEAAKAALTAATWAEFHQKRIENEIDI